MTNEDITQLLRDACAGEATAHAALFERLQRELRELAERHLRNERVGHTLQPTAVIHEAWIKLFGDRDPEVEGFEGRRHFLRAASGAMRHVLIDHARRRLADKRGGGRRVDVATGVLEGVAVTGPDPTELLQVHEALAELEQSAPDQAEIVQLRYFGGLEVLEVAALLEISDRTVKRRWALARAWLYRRIHGGDPASD